MIGQNPESQHNGNNSNNNWTTTSDWTEVTPTGEWGIKYTQIITLYSVLAHLIWYARA